MLLIDATDAFNSLNRKLALENIKVVCPYLHFPLKHSYASPCSLFDKDKTILSPEGTTHADPFEMSMNGIVWPLVKKLVNTDIVQKMYVDDGNAVGKLIDLHQLHEALAEDVPVVGYHITQCHTLAENNHLENTK